MPRPVVEQTADALGREIYVFGTGLGSGAVAEIQKHPVEALTQTGCAVAGRAILGSLAAV
jgi:hypothetical protein